VAKKTYIVIPILRSTSGGAEKDNCSAETEKIGAENESAEKSAETGGNLLRNPINQDLIFHILCCIQLLKYP
jgi:hypothetical protein